MTLRSRVADLEAALLDDQHEDTVTAIMLRVRSGRIGGSLRPDADIAALRDGTGRLTFRRLAEPLDALAHRAAATAAPAVPGARPVLMCVYSARDAT